MKGLAFLLIIVLILALAVIVGSQNDAVITVNYLIAKADITVATLIAIAMGLGIVVGMLVMFTSWLSLRVQLIRARVRINKIQKDS